MITKEVARAGLAFCCLQEVRYRNTGKQRIRLDSGEEYDFLWCGMKKRRDAGVGFLIKIDATITATDPDICDPRIMAINMTIAGFRVRIINGYSPTNIDGSTSQKEEFYRKLRKACIKQEKHQKIIIAGDFNAQTEIIYGQCFFDGLKVIEDNNCNDNGYRLKSFCRERGYCLPQTYYDHPHEERYTWFSNDGRTKKVLDYVLLEPFVQQYVTQCSVESKYNFDSDHRLVVT